MKKTLLTIAGFDPSAGAGVLLDVRVFEALGFHGSAVLTSVTAQNTARVRKVFPFPPSFIKLQYEALEEDLHLAGIKVGMLGSGDLLAVVARILGKSRKIPRIIDPVFLSSSGAPLVEKKAVPRYLEAFRGRASLITPNAEEASLLAGLAVRSPEESEQAARMIHAALEIPCLVKGGHLPGPPVDILFDGRRVVRFPHLRIKKDVRGTGCFLSAAILAGLARGNGLAQACSGGIALTARALRKARRAGRGRNVFG